jgi:hypothetical protein
MNLVTYSTGEPNAIGVYACRVDHLHGDGLLSDIFLMRSEGQWWYLGSDQKFRLRVHGWIGPLQRRISERAAAEAAYTTDHHEGGPIGSRDWDLYFAGWMDRANTGAT